MPRQTDRKRCSVFDVGRNLFGGERAGRRGQAGSEAGPYPFRGRGLGRMPKIAGLKMARWEDSTRWPPPGEGGREGGADGGEERGVGRSDGDANALTGKGNLLIRP